MSPSYVKYMTLQRYRLPRFPWTLSQRWENWSLVEVLVKVLVGCSYPIDLRGCLVDNLLHAWKSAFVQSAFFVPLHNMWKEYIEISRTSRVLRGTRIFEIFSFKTSKYVTWKQRRNIYKISNPERRLENFCDAC